MNTILISPPAKMLGREHAILSTTDRWYYVPDFETSLSIKTVLCGSASWEVESRRFIVHPGMYVVVNDGQKYTITIDSYEPVTTFCVFFKRGFVEDIFRNRLNSNCALLDDPERKTTIEFAQHLIPDSPRVLSSVNHLRDGLHNPLFDSLTALSTLAEHLIEADRQLLNGVHKVQSNRDSTRQELHRRVLRGRDYLLSSLDTNVANEDAARAAGLSPYHFHRVFREVFRETPHVYLTRYRLFKAQQLLLSTDRSVTDICLECGFHSPPSFTHLFRRYFGQTPRELRQKSKIR
jgi:AraC-like DNA-binding protein